jgi:hypothetical protein
MYMNHEMKKFACAFAVASMLVVSATANAEVLTFDDVPDGLIPNGYGGLEWTAFATNSDTNLIPSTGYENGVVSGSKTAFNGIPGGSASFGSATAFSLNDAFFTGAWRDGLQIHVVATSGSNTYTKDFKVDTTGPVDIFFNWSNLNSVSFSARGGVHHFGLDGNSTQFAMDNLRINEVVTPVPEPETYAMLLVGLGLIGFMARRREHFNY